MFHGSPWHAAVCGDIDLPGDRKPQSYYRDILWNGGDRVYAAVRLPEPDGKKIIAVGWATYPSLPAWTWPGEEGKPLQAKRPNHHHRQAPGLSKGSATIQAAAATGAVELR